MTTIQPSPKLTAARDALLRHAPVTDAEADTQIARGADELVRKALRRQQGCWALAFLSAVVAVAFSSLEFSSGAGLIYIAAVAALLGRILVGALWPDPLRYFDGHWCLGHPRAIAMASRLLTPLTSGDLVGLANTARRSEDAANAVKAWLATPGVTLRHRDREVVLAFVGEWDEYQTALRAMQSLRDGEIDSGIAHPRAGNAQ